MVASSRGCRSAIHCWIEQSRFINPSLSRSWWETGADHRHRHQHRGGFGIDLQSVAEILKGVRVIALRLIGAGAIDIGGELIVLRLLRDRGDQPVAVPVEGDDGLHLAVDRDALAAVAPVLRELVDAAHAGHAGGAGDPAGLQAR